MRTLSVGVVLGLLSFTHAQTVDFQVDTNWGTGFQATMTVNAPAGSALSGWELSFDWPHPIASLWGGQFAGPSGGRYTVTDAGWNAAVPAGSSVQFSFNASWNGAPSEPSNACLNGQAVPVNGVPSGSSCSTTLPVPPPGSQISGPVPPNRSGKRLVGYFAAWSVYGRNYHVPQIPADDVTHVNYAFANISAAGTITLGDPYADIDRFYPGDCWAPGCLRGSFNRLNILKSEHPHLKTLISVGGWTWSGRFSDVALTTQSRQLFATSCVDFIVTYGFDGVDIDWEYPVSGGLATNTTRPEDKQNYTLLLAELRAQLDAREVLDGREYLLTIASPAGPAIMNNIELDLIHPYLDWINVMAYDFHGGWSPITNFNAALYPATGDPSPAPVATEFNCDAAIQGYLAAGVPAGKLHLGVPYYGRGWQGVSSAQGGLFQPHGGLPPGSWEPGVFDYKDLAQNYVGTYTRTVHPEAMVPWLYDPATQIMISYDDPQSLGVKADYVNAQGLGGVMMWEFSSDDAQDVLTRALSDRLLDPAPYIQISTSGGGVGDLGINVWAVPAAASHVILLASATPAPAGPGTGSVFGLVPDALFTTLLQIPPSPNGPTHFPVIANPYAAGALSWSAGMFPGLAGQQWEVFAGAYDTQLGVIGASGIAVLGW